MIASISYALVLFVHPDPEPRVYANFATAADCRTERAAVVQDLGGAKITAACVPQNQITMSEIETQMRAIMSTMRNMHQQIESEEKF